MTNTDTQPTDLPLPNMLQAEVPAQVDCVRVVCGRRFDPVRREIAVVAVLVP